MNIRQVHLTTIAAGTASVDVRILGEILAVFVDIGDLSTPDVDLTDKTTGKVILSVDGVAADTYYATRALQQSTAGVDLAAAAGPPVLNDVYAPVIATGLVTVAVTGAGNLKSGDIYIAYRG